MVNSIVFDVSAADLDLTNSQITGIFTNFSSPAIYIENDASASDLITLNMRNSKFIGNTATDMAGVVYAKNTNVNISESLFQNNTAMTGDAGALYLDCEDSVAYQCTYNIVNTTFR